MKLYHFTGDKDIVTCCKEGLKLGMIPTYDEEGQLTAIPNYQWLTTDKEFSHQGWNTSHVINYDRTAFRILINIPKHRRAGSLLHWVDVCDTLCHPRMVEELHSIGYPEDWYIYHGKIKTGWFREIVDKQGKIHY